MIFSRPLLVIVLFLILCTSLKAQIADASGDWDTGTNWDTDTSPSTDFNNTSVTVGSGFDIDYTGVNDINFLANGSGDLTVGGTLTVANDVVFLNNAGSGHTITVTGDMTIDGDVIFEGNANADNAFVVSGNLTISGDLIMQNNAGGQNGIEILNGGVLIIQGNWSVINSALNRLDINSGGTLIVGGDFNTGFGSNINNEGSVYASSYSGSNGESALQGDGGSTGSMEDLATEDSSSCANTSSCSASLPVELLSYQLSSNDGFVVLKWTTASEINNDYFDIEKSVDGKNYEFTARIEGNGNSTSEMDYEWIDVNPGNSTVYYKLIQYDYDGAFEELGIRASHILEIPTSIAMYPSPATAASKLTFVGNAVDELIIHDSSGRVLSHESILSNEFMIPQGFETGIYFVKMITTNGAVTTNRLVIE